MQKNSIKIILMSIVFILLSIGISACTRHALPTVYSVEYYAEAGGEIVGETSQRVEEGETGLPVTAKANEGYEFVCWTDGLTTATRTDTVQSDISVTAKFAKVYTVEYKTDGNGTVQGETTQKVQYGEDGTEVTAKADEGYVFVCWSDGLTTATRTDTVRGDISVTAKFAKIVYTVEYKTDGNGTVQGETTQKVQYGETGLSVTATADEGYEFVCWSDGLTTATRTDTVRGDISVTAKFAKIVYTVEYKTDGNGTVQGETTQKVQYGEEGTEVTATANEGYDFVCWSDGLTTATRRESDLTADVSVTAMFSKKTFRVRYEVNDARFGGLKQENVTYTVMFLEYQVAYGDDAPSVSALPRQNGLNNPYTFVYWSDGETSNARQDREISGDMTITAYFGYTVRYEVNGNTGGKIAGETVQKIPIGDAYAEVAAVPFEGYVFCGWSDLLMETERHDDIPEEDLIQHYTEWTYIAYFEPIEKVFRYDYGIAGGTPLTTKITLNRNAIQTAEFMLPKCAGYTFCGWYADGDYHTRITTETGRYMYGYAAFMLETDTLYAKWQKIGEETDNHKILLIYVDEIETELYSSVLDETVKVHSRMSALDYQMSRWATETMGNLLSEWFGSEVVFEIDCYYTTSVVREGFEKGLTIYGMTAYRLFAYGISEVFDIMYAYHNTLTTFGLDDYERYLLGVDISGVSVQKDGCVFREAMWSRSISRYIPCQDYVLLLQENRVDLNETIMHVYFHEFSHTAELIYGTEYYHTVLEQLNMPPLASTKLFLLYQCEITVESLGVIRCGVPMEYWKHEIEMPVSYSAQVLDGRIAGRIYAVGEDEDDRPAGEYFISRVAYGGSIEIEAVPMEGYAFVRWSDGVTTAVRRDEKIISRISVQAIFEKI